MGQVTLINPETGEAVSVAEERADEAIQAFGYQRESAGAGVQRQLESEMERAYGDQEIQGAIEGGLRAATFGASDVVLPALPGISREGVRERRERTTGAVVGEVATDIGLALASGGTGLLGRVASLTPSGALARATGRYVAEGGSAMIGRAALAGAGEGVAAAASGVLSDIALTDEPIATDAIAARLGLGAITGGAAGGLAGLVARAPSALTQRLANQADAAPRATAAGLADEVDTLAKAGSATGKPLRYESFLAPSKRTTRAAGEELANVLVTIDDAAARRTAAAGDLRRVTAPDGMLAKLPAEEGLALRTELGVALEQHGAAVNDARRWARTVSRDLGPEALRAGKLPPLPEAQVQDAVDVLARLDESTAALDRVMGRVQQRAGELVPPPGLAPEVVTPPAAPSRWAAWGEKLADAGAVLETLQTAGVPGIPDVDQLPVIGPVLGAYLKFRAVSQALGRKTASFAPTPKARAAAQVTATRERIEAVAERVAMAAPRAVPVVSRAAAAGGVALLRSAQSSAQAAIEEARALERVRAQAQAQLVGVPQAMRDAAADRAVAIAEYMAKHAPKPPFGGTPWAPKAWQPSTVEAMEWMERVDARSQPLDVLEDLANGLSRPIAAGAVREMFPELWQAQRTELLKRIEEIAGKVPREQRLNIGRSFDIPMDPSQLPGYKPAVAESAPPSQEAGFNAGPVSGSSPSAKLAETAEAKRMAR